MAIKPIDDHTSATYIKYTKVFKVLIEYFERDRMDDDRFERMMEGMKQGASILKGLTKPSQTYKVTVKVPDIKNIREKLNVSQPEFAEMLGISVRTLQNWEQKHRLPGGPARILLEVAAAYPDQVRQVSRKILGLSCQEHNFSSHHENCSNIP